MKKILLALALIALVAVPAGAQLPWPGAIEQETWKLVDGVWVSQAVGQASALARAWTSVTAQGSCNKQTWTVDVTTHASVAQWIEWSLSGTRWDWRVMKPGTYATDCITATLKSNGAVAINYDGFADLAYQGTGGVEQTIDTWYAFGPTIPAPTSSSWVRAADLNNDDDLVPDSAALHAGLSWKLWNKIQVVECNSACEYEDTATITLVLQTMKPWVDPTTGGWADLIQ
ncbi:MAG: hypothetical protein NUW23_07620 [Firmicutes bacterium]|jgi:hypothetical protein|nr:hypothetical protein [Bacillota bacterium]